MYIFITFFNSWKTLIPYGRNKFNLFCSFFYLQCLRKHLAQKNIMLWILITNSGEKKPIPEIII